MKSILSSRIYLFLFSLFLIGLSACNNDSTADLPEPTSREIWTGSNLTFEKADETDVADAANQDRITDNVWITRGTDGGQIFNIKSESDSNKNSSPSGTQWAIGSISDIDNLDFKSFRDAVDKPKNVVGKDLVLFLVEDEIFISVKFTKWTEGKAGGFAYERSTK